MNIDGGLKWGGGNYSLKEQFVAVTIDSVTVKYAQQMAVSSMSQNTVFIGNDNPVIVNFSFTGDFSVDGLSNFTDIQVGVGSESYTLLTNPSNVVVSSNTQLRIKIGDSTALGTGLYPLKIVGFSATYDDGYVLMCNDSDWLRFVTCQ
jgi:hypothetical protein